MLPYGNIIGFILGKSSKRFPIENYYRPRQRNRRNDSRSGMMMVPATLHTLHPCSTSSWWKVAQKTMYNVREFHSNRLFQRALKSSIGY
jgi:hypothetical protein